MTKFMTLAALLVAGLSAQASIVTFTGPMQLEVKYVRVKDCNSHPPSTMWDEEVGAYDIGFISTLIGCSRWENPFNLKTTTTMTWTLGKGESLPIKRSALAGIDFKVSTDGAGVEAGTVTFSGPMVFDLSYKRKQNCNKPFVGSIELENGANYVLAIETEMYCGPLDNPFGIFKSRVTATYTIKDNQSFKVSADSLESFDLEIK